jgi:hypothetical protein
MLTIIVIMYAGGIEHCNSPLNIYFKQKLMTLTRSISINILGVVPKFLELRLFSHEGLLDYLCNILC